MPDERTPPEDQALRVVVAALLGVFLLRSAWVGDDAYVTLRTIDHFVHGRGLVYNVGERAQAFTHPLWLALLTPFYVLVGHPWWTAILVGAGTTLATFVALSRRLVPPGAAPLLLALPLSRAFVDYGTSGLENPLSHLLLVGLAVAWTSPRDSVARLRGVALCTGLLGLVRLDLLLFALPVLVASYVQARWDSSLRERVGLVARGLSPLVAWTAFALFYYGSALPTSALAKLNTGQSATALAKQGMLYLLHQAEWDPLTLVVVLAGTAAPFVARDRRGMVLAAGNLLFLAYVVRVGGDFMAGRFLTAPLVVGLVLLARVPATPAWIRGLAAVLALLALSTPSSPLRQDSGVASGRLNDRGIVDERLYYASRGADIGEVRAWTDDPAQHWRYWAAKEPPDHVQLDEPAGYPAFYAHPDVHWVVRYGITDPLLARLPPYRKLEWRPGHYDRKVPAGYLKTLKTGENVIEDPEIARLYDTIHLVTSGPLFSVARLRAIWRLNTGGDPFDPGPWRYPDAKVLPDGPPPSGSDALDAPGVLGLTDSGAIKHFPGGSHASSLDFRRREDLPFLLVFERDHAPIAELRVETPPPRRDRLAWTRVDVPRRAVRDGYDAVRILPLRGKAPFPVHYLGAAP